MTAPYIKAICAFEKWKDSAPSSETDFNNAFRPIRNDFLTKSFANTIGTYTKNGCKQVIPKRNLLRELIFAK